VVALGDQAGENTLLADRLQRVDRVERLVAGQTHELALDIQDVEAPGRESRTAGRQRQHDHQGGCGASGASPPVFAAAHACSPRIFGSVALTHWLVIWKRCSAWTFPARLITNDSGGPETPKACAKLLLGSRRTG